jgi:RNA-directed DNA polymerase
MRLSGGVIDAEGKPFQIPKDRVWEAYQKVRANKVAPGADGQSVADFEKDLKNNPYKIWNGCPQAATSRSR